MQEERFVAFIVHGFTVAHMIVALVSGPAAGPFLTPMTISMVVIIADLCGKGANTKSALKVMAQFLGFILGCSIAEFIVGLFPFAGNFANCIATGIVTEILGFTTYIVLRDDISEKLSFWQKISLLRLALRMKKSNQEFLNQLKRARKSMTTEIRAKYDACMKIITNKDAAVSQRQEAIHTANELLKPYGIFLNFA